MTECCGHMAEVLEKSDGPFDYPTYLDKEHNLKADRLAVTAYKLTLSKKTISRRGRMTIFLSYCPFCGKKLKGGNE